MTIREPTRATWLGPWGWLLIVLLVLPRGVDAQTDESGAMRRATFLYNLPAFVEWPDRSVQRPREPIVIAVVGSDPVAASLEGLAAARKTAAVYPVVVRRLQSGEPAGGVQVLFIAATTPERMAQALKAAEGAVLVVTEQEGGLDAGAVLNLVPDQGPLRFSASLVAAQARNLRLSARLLALATSVEGRPR